MGFLWDKALVSRLLQNCSNIPSKAPRLRICRFFLGGRNAEEVLWRLRFLGFRGLGGMELRGLGGLQGFQEKSGGLLGSWFSSSSKPGHVSQGGVTRSLQAYAGLLFGKLMSFQASSYKP